MEDIRISLAKLKAENDAFTRRLNEVMSIDQKATALEKSGEIEKAVTEYENAIRCSYKIFHPFERLLVYYRKIKDYENEMRVALVAFKTWPNDVKLSKRIARIKELMQK